MAKLPTVRRIIADDIPDAPTWFIRGGVLRTFNEVIDSQVNSLDKNISFSSNIDCQIKELNIRTPAAYSSSDSFNQVNFASSLNGRCLGVSIAQILKRNNTSSPITNPVTVDWYEKEDQIRIRFITGLQDSTDYFVRFIAWR